MTKHGLYQKLILDHGKSPRNFHKIPDATHRAEGNNPFCGDQFEVFLDVQEGEIEDISFVGSGCAVSTASASLMTKVLKGKSTEHAMRSFDRFIYLLTEAEDVNRAEEEALLGTIVALLGVREFPMRIKCASLPWHTMRAALQGKESTSLE